VRTRRERRAWFAACCLDAFLSSMPRRRMAPRFHWDRRTVALWIKKGGAE
jgi:hypothetical protein